MSLTQANKSLTVCRGSYDRQFHLHGEDHCLVLDPTFDPLVKDHEVASEKLSKLLNALKRKGLVTSWVYTREYGRGPAGLDVAHRFPGVFSAHFELSHVDQTLVFQVFQESFLCSLMHSR